ncbi:hypothetical protein V8C34DRAFT_289861 [Trichoderma compactum]
MRTSTLLVLLLQLISDVGDGMLKPPNIHLHSTPTAAFKTKVTGSRAVRTTLYKTLLKYRDLPSQLAWSCIETLEPQCYGNKPEHVVAAKGL